MPTHLAENSWFPLTQSRFSKLAILTNSTMEESPPDFYALVLRLQCHRYYTKAALVSQCINIISSRYTPLPFPAMPQIDGCARQMNGLPFRLSTSRFSRRENMGVAVTGRLASAKLAG